MGKRSFNHSLAIWPTLPLNVHFKTATNWRPFPLNQDNCRIYSLARHAIWNACHAMGLDQGDVVLVPAYHHGSEVEALLQAGLQIRYYELDDALEPDAAQLETLLGPNVRALYLIHYLGFPQNAIYWRQWCDDRNLLLMEDAAQAFLATYKGRPVGSFGHMGVFCLYKTYGIPDGGAVITSHPPASPALTVQTGIWRAFKRHVNFVAARRSEIGWIHLSIKPLLTQWRRKWHVMQGQLTIEFEMGNPATPPSAMTVRLLPKILDEKTADCRRENYRFLLKHLGDMVPGPFASLPDGACPFAFPIEVEDARAFLQKLRRKGVMGLLFWLTPHPSLPVEDFPRSRALREKVLALPVHQELTMDNLQQIVAAVKAVRDPEKEPVSTASVAVLHKLE